MRFLISFVALFALFFNVALAAKCFDNFDCIGKGGNCVREKGKLLGECKPKEGTPTSDAPVPTATAKPPRGACFDNFDCIGKGGNCVKEKGKLLGKCQPKEA